MESTLVHNNAGTRLDLELLTYGGFTARKDIEYPNMLIVFNHLI